MKTITQLVPDHHARESRTCHARTQMQRRSAPSFMVELLAYYSDEARTANGYIRYFGKKSRKRIARDFGKEFLDVLPRYLSCYLIEADDGRIVTVGYRYKRIRRFANRRSGHAQRLGVRR